MKWYIASFLAGLVTSVAMVMLSFRFHVGIQNPYFIFFVVLLIVQVLFLFIRNGGPTKSSPIANLLTFLGQAAVFILGGAGAFYSLMAIYPPNIG